MIFIFFSQHNGLLPVYNDKINATITLCDISILSNKSSTLKLRLLKLLLYENCFMEFVSLDITPCTMESMFTCKAELIFCHMNGEHKDQKNLNAAVPDNDDDDDRRRILSSAAGTKSVFGQVIERQQQQQQQNSSASHINHAFTEDGLNKG